MWCKCDVCLICDKWDIKEEMKTEGSFIFCTEDTEYDDMIIQYNNKDKLNVDDYNLFTQVFGTICHECLPPNLILGEHGEFKLIDPMYYLDKITPNSPIMVWSIEQK